MRNPVRNRLYQPSPDPDTVMAYLRLAAYFIIGFVFNRRAAAFPRSRTFYFLVSFCFFYVGLSGLAVYFHVLDALTTRIMLTLLLVITAAVGGWKYIQSHRGKDRG